MSLTTTLSSDKTQLTIAIEGRFDFNLHRNFRDAYRLIAGPELKITVDLGKTQYMDSSALGMLLVLRDKAGGEKAKISVVKCNPEIKKIFAISNMDKMFEIV